MLSEYKISAFSKPVSDLADIPNISAGELKRHFDSNSYELLDALNGMIDYLSGDNALKELKSDGKGIEEMLSEIKALIANEALERQNEDEKKADKITGKGLSANDFTDDLKEKLEGLKNYDDTAVKELINAETAAREAADDLKVDKVSGKDLSANDFTDELKLKLENISALPKVAWENIDSCKTAGTYLVTGRKDYDTTPVEGGSYAEYSGGYPILIVSNYTYYDNGQYNESGYRQVLYDANGKAVWRMDYTGMGGWSEWSDCIAAPTVIHQSQIQSVSSTVTTYTFNPKSYLSPSAAFSINHTGTNTVTFNFGNVTSGTYTNEILIYFKTALDNAVVWGSNVKFTDDEVPTIEAGVYYRIIGEYNPLMGKWVVGVVSDGKGAA